LAGLAEAGVAGVELMNEQRTNEPAANKGENEAGMPLLRPPLQPLPHSLPPSCARLEIPHDRLQGQVGNDEREYETIRSSKTGDNNRQARKSKT
jgi:hypothetical protein